MISQPIEHRITIKNQIDTYNQETRTCFSGKMPQTTAYYRQDKQFL